MVRCGVVRSVCGFGCVKVACVVVMCKGEERLSGIRWYIYLDILSSWFVNH